MPILILLSVVFMRKRYNGSDGTPVWPNMTKLSNKGAYAFLNYNTLKDGDTVYFGYHQSDTRWDSYLQRINADGSIPWGINGADFSTTNNYEEMYTYLAMQRGSNTIKSLVYGK